MYYVYTYSMCIFCRKRVCISRLVSIFGDVVILSWTGVWRWSEKCLLLKCESLIEWLCVRIPAVFSTRRNSKTKTSSRLNTLHARTHTSAKVKTADVVLPLSFSSHYIWLCSYALYCDCGGAGASLTRTKSEVSLPVETSKSELALHTLFLWPPGNGLMGKYYFGPHNVLHDDPLDYKIMLYFSAGCHRRTMVGYIIKAKKNNYFAHISHLTFINNQITFFIEID